MMTRTPHLILGLLLLPTLAAGDTAALDARATWAALEAEQRQFECDLATVEVLKAQFTDPDHAVLHELMGEAVADYEQHLYELRREVPAEAVAYLAGRSETMPPGTVAAQTTRALAAIAAALPTLRESILATPIVNAAFGAAGENAQTILERHAPDYLELHTLGRLRTVEETIAADTPPYGRSIGAAQHLVRALGWDHDEAVRLFGLAISQRWFGPGHGDVASAIGNTMRRAQEGDTAAVLSAMEALLASDLPKQPGFFTSLEAAYRDAGYAEKADRLRSDLVAADHPGAIRATLRDDPEPRERRALLQRLADSGQINGPEAWQLAGLWAAGEAGPRDGEVADRLRAIALEKNHPEACHNEALRLAKLPPAQIDTAHYRQLLEISWKHGHKDVARLLYPLVRDGIGGPADAALARATLLAAAEQGDVAACRATGRGYATGAGGLPRDPARARPFLERAMAAGDAFSTALLARIHLEGQGVPADLRKARELFRRALELGHWTRDEEHVYPASVIAALERDVPCAECKGAGKTAGTARCDSCDGRGGHRCRKCSGRGSEKKYHQEFCRAGCRGGYFSYQRQTGVDYSGRPIHTTERVRCDSCGGRGSWSASQDVSCRTCGGDGTTRCSTCRGDGRMKTSGACRPCGGDGRIPRYDARTPFSSSELPGSA